MGYRAPGHMSILKDGSNYYMVSHTRTDKLAGYNFFISVRQMYKTSDNWFVLDPNEYVGATLQTVSTTIVAGSYDIILTTTGTSSNATFIDTLAVNTENTFTNLCQEDLMASSTTYTFSENGTVTVTNSSGTTGTWTLSNDNEISISLDGETYKGYVIATNDLNGNHVISITTLGSDGNFLFGNCVKS
jgi:arabinan endo-1,5-alpha-L-arabinosidase